MTISTKCKFWYLPNVDETNYAIDFNEGGAELQASLDYKSYSPEEYATEIARAMTEAGGQTYSCSLNRSTRKLTISASSGFELLAATGSRIGVGAFTDMGYAATDTGSATSHVADSGVGTEYVPQFYLQNYISSDDYQEYIDSTINESASGEIEVVSFGLRKKFQMKLTFITNVNTGNQYIDNNASAVAQVRSFLQNITQKTRIEFMPDKDTPSTYHTLILDNYGGGNGTSYRLKEMYGKGLPNFYETDDMIFRKVD